VIGEISEAHFTGSKNLGGGWALFAAQFSCPGAEIVKELGIDGF